MEYEKGFPDFEEPFTFKTITFHYYSTTMGLYFGTRAFMMHQPMR